MKEFPEIMDFNTELKKLNRQQRQAVEAIEGPVMVIAGPGTGKTQILTLRIANIIKKTDTDPENILAITFTDSGAFSMRKRLASMIGSVAYYVNITTFHSFANTIITDYPEYFPHIIGANSITDIDQIKLMEQVILSGRLKALRPFGDPLYYLKPALNAINELKREGIAPDEFSKIIQQEEKKFEKIPDLRYEAGENEGKIKTKYAALEKQIRKNKELTMVYGAYQKELRRQRKYDYSDMVMEVVSALTKNRDLRFMIQEKYHYILVDEHQDTNNAQNKILELLAGFHKNPNLFVVGDEKQAIFRFQGASLENFLYFKKLYPSAKLIKLQYNYRSTQTILDIATKLKKSDIRLKSQKKSPEAKISLFVFNKTESEWYYVARHIKERLSKGVPAQEIAVLHRDNRDAFPIVDMFNRLGVPYYVESEQNIFDDPNIKKLILLFEAIRDFGSKATLIPLMHADFLNISSLDIYKISSVTGGGVKKLYENPYDVIKSERVMRELKLDSVKELSELYSRLTLWRKDSQYKSLTELFEQVVRESGLLAHILKSSHYLDDLEKINTLFDEVKRLQENHKGYTLGQFLDYLNLLQEQDVLIKRTSVDRPNDRVRVMTAHRSKGQEFGYVYIINAFNGHWGNKRRVSHFKLPSRVFSLIKSEQDLVLDENEDERNLFYVALTRAKYEVAISYAKTGLNGRDQLPSQFITELDKKLISNVDGEKYEQEFEKKRGILFQEAKKGRAPLEDRKFLRELFLDQGLSVTALNNYLECPWKYFYRNLLRVPEAKTKHEMYGTAVHAALRDFFEQINLGNSPDKQFLIRHFNDALSREPIQQSDYDEALEKGEKALSGYFDAHKKEWKYRTFNEFNIARVELAKDIGLTGKIDKIDLLSHGGSPPIPVHVVDYKTGKPQSRREIEGQTKSSNGGYKRQLVFYKLLLQLYKNGKYNMKSGAIDFVEPDEKGRYHTEVFEISDAEVGELEKLIKEVSKEILNTEYWGQPCNQEVCGYCDLREVMADSGNTH